MTARETAVDVAESDAELRLLSHSSAGASPGEEFDRNTLQIATVGTPEPRHNLHQVIGEALEVFSRHLRADN